MFHLGHALALIFWRLATLAYANSHVNAITALLRVLLCQNHKQFVSTSLDATSTSESRSMMHGNICKCICTKCMRDTY